MGLDVGSLLQGTVSRIVVRSNLAPPIVIDDPFAGGGGGGGGALNVIRPRIEIYDATGALVTAVAPAGDPSDVPLVPLLLILAGVAAAVAVAVVTSR